MSIMETCLYSKHKTAELEGALLDAAVAKALGLHPIPGQPPGFFYWAELKRDGSRVPESGWFAPSTIWQHGGPIIERERIATMYVGDDEGWSADFEIEWSMLGIEHKHTGPTPLIAAMRAYVASKLGEEVDL